MYGRESPDVAGVVDEQANDKRQVNNKGRERVLAGFSTTLLLLKNL
jgi:hypothetical protein